MNIYLQALLNTAMGMATVFIVLILISMIISLFVYVPKLERKLRHFSIKRKRRAPKKPAPADPNRKRPKRPILRPEIYKEPEIDNNELIAVIMAAIVASEGGAVSADKLVVRSIKRVNRRR